MYTTGNGWIGPNQELNAGSVVGRLAFSDSDHGIVMNPSFLTTNSASRHVTCDDRKLGR